MAVTDFYQDLIYQRTMRGNDQKQEAMFSYLTLAQRIPMDHPARQIRTLVDRALERMDAELEKLYSDAGRPSIAPERLLLAMLDRTVAPKQERDRELEITLGADTLYQEEKFIEALRDREVAPHVSEYTQGGSNMGKNSLTEAERSDARRSISQRKRKLIERVLGWSKLDRGLRQVKLRGLDRVDWFYRLTIVAHNLVRMQRLIPIESLAH